MDITSAEISHIFNFATEQAKTIVSLHYIVLGICLTIALTVISLVTLSALKFRQRSDEEPEQSEGDMRLEIMWTAIPFLIVSFLGVATLVVMHAVNPPVGSRQPDVIVNAHQWWWEYRYPKSGAVTANELYLPEGVDSLLEIRAADVNHCFWVPNFGEKIDAIPGHPNHLFLKPLRKGVFVGSCAEYCGDDHALMRIVANVVPQKEFDSWIQSQLTVPQTADDPVAQRGEQLLMSNSCTQCHSIAGTDAKGKIAPDLTHLAMRKTIGSGVIANNVENLAKWITDAQQFKPGCYMPKMRLKPDEAHAIAVYLETLK